MKKKEEEEKEKEKEKEGVLGKLWGKKKDEKVVEEKKAEVEEVSNRFLVCGAGLIAWIWWW